MCLPLCACLCGAQKGALKAFCGFGVCPCWGLARSGAFRGLFGGEGGRAYPGVFFYVLDFGGVTPTFRSQIFVWDARDMGGYWRDCIYYTRPFREQKNLCKAKVRCHIGVCDYILCPYLDRAKILMQNLMQNQGYGVTRAIWRLYIKRTFGNGCVCSMAPTRLPKNGKRAAKTIRQNAQWRKAVLWRMARRKVN